MSGGVVRSFSPRNRRSGVVSIKSLPYMTSEGFKMCVLTVHSCMRHAREETKQTPCDVPQLYNGLWMELAKIPLARPLRSKTGLSPTPNASLGRMMSIDVSTFSDGSVDRMLTHTASMRTQRRPALRSLAVAPVPAAIVPGRAVWRRRRAGRPEERTKGMQVAQMGLKWFGCGRWLTSDLTSLRYKEENMDKHPGSRTCLG